MAQEKVWWALEKTPSPEGSCLLTWEQGAPQRVGRHPERVWGTVFYAQVPVPRGGKTQSPGPSGEGMAGAAMGEHSENPGPLHTGGWQLFMNPPVCAV